jgi:signal transduction histidine kinase
VACDVNGLVTEIAEGAGAHADKAFRVECDLDDDVPVALLDRAAIHRCLLNLLSNAVDAAPDEDGVVRFGTRHDREANAVRVFVADNGDGIAPELLPSIFNVFVSTKGSRGTGLGLAVVQKLVEEHGGRVEIDSEPGKGTTVALVLPLPDPSERPTKTDMQPPSPTP